MQFNKHIFRMMAFTGFFAVSGMAFAIGDHAHDHENEYHHRSTGHNAADQESSGAFLVKQHIDGYDVSFHVMRAKSGKGMGDSHDFMIKVEKDGQAVDNIIMNTKVIHPDGQSEMKQTMKMGGWLMAAYNLDHPGKHQMMILFKGTDGKEHTGGIFYPGG